MTTSASTARIRLTQALYLLALLLVAVSGGRSLQGLPGLGAQALGFVLVVLGTLWRLWTTAFIAGRKDVQLVEEGPYARCRHPLYLGSLVAGLGLALTTRSVTLMVALPATLVLLHGSALHREEAFLAARHGEAWRAYRARVPALWPRRGPLPAPARRELDLAIYRKAFLDAATVLALWLLIVALDALRSQGAWPAAFNLP